MSRTLADFDVVMSEMDTTFSSPESTLRSETVAVEGMNSGQSFINALNVSMRGHRCETCTSVCMLPVNGRQANRLMRVPGASSAWAKLMPPHR